MNRSLFVISGIIVLGIVGAGLILFLQPTPMAGITAPTFSIGGKQRYVEIVNPAGFVNTDSITIGELVGKKVILVEFLTYSCINCQRTFPYVTGWYKQYKDEGLEIVGIHTPEFAFEKNIENVRAAMKEHGITYPIVLDNDYATWRAYENQYWPRKYLIDIDGNIVYDHIGEGGYVETEMKIQELLAERAKRLGETVSDKKTLVAATLPEEKKQKHSPEIYFGSERNTSLALGRRFISGEQTLVLPETFTRNALYLGGTWKISPEHAESRSESTSIVVRYSARDVFFVASADTPVDIVVFQDGIQVHEVQGADVSDGVLNVNDERLYKLIRNPGVEEHTLELRVKGKGLKAFTFTFG